jgi:hypothetical protein
MLLMRRRSPRHVHRWFVAFAAFVLAAGGLGMLTAAPAAAQSYTPLPAHVYAPYYETYLAPNTPGLAATAGVRGEILHAGVPADA